MRRFIASALLIFAAGCGSVSEPEGEPGMTGAIVARDQTISIGGPPTVHVKEKASDQCGIVFRVTSSTKLLRRNQGGSVAKASLSEFTVGRQVRVWSDVTLLSCPGQAVAEALELVD